MKMLINILKKLHGTGIGKIWPFDLLAKTYYRKVFRNSKERIKRINIQNNKFDIYINPKEGHVDQQIFMSSMYEPEITKIFIGQIKKNDVVVDVGANIGYYTLLSSKIVGKGGKVYAFEPSRIIFKKLKKNININNIKNVVAECKGCGLKKQLLELTVYPDQLGYSRINTIKEKKLEKIKEKIEIINLDKYFSKEKKISFVKVDVEGYEYEVIFGMKKTIEKFRPKIILEFSPEFYEKKEREKRQEKLLSYLLSKYKLFSLKNKSEIKNKEKYLKQLGVKQDNIFCYVKD